MTEGKSERLADLCLQAGATDYVSGPSARDYIVPEVFSSRGLGLHFARALVQFYLNATLTFTSDEGHGTTFTLLLRD